MNMSGITSYFHTLYLENHSLPVELVNLQMIVGSEDFDIRVFREDEIIAEMTETEVSY